MRKSIAKIAAVLAVLLTVISTVGAVALCAVFPNKYAAEINAAADEFGIDATLVRAVVWAESKFDRNAVSDKGAKGLMQLMPGTFEECAAALTVQNADPLSPVDNLRCGCYYLSTLIDRFNGDVRGALMAYNAGEANARRFLDGEPIFSETAVYLKDIALARKFYGIFD